MSTPTDYEVKDIIEELKRTKRPDQVLVVEFAVLSSPHDEQIAEEICLELGNAKIPFFVTNIPREKVTFSFVSNDNMDDYVEAIHEAGGSIHMFQPLAGSDDLYTAELIPQNSENQL